MKIKYLAYQSIAFLTISLFLLAPTVSAHFLQTDGSIGAILHIDPEDDPIISQTAHIFLEIKDTSDQFKAEDCNCTLQLLRNEDMVDVKSMQPSANNTTGITGEIIFPVAGIYIVKVTGSPKEEGQFQPFTLQYEIRATRQPEIVASKSNSYVDYIGVGLIIFVLLSLLVYKIISYRKNSGQNITFKSIIILLFFSINLLALHHSYFYHPPPVPDHHQHGQQTMIQPCCLPFINFSITLPLPQPLLKLEQLTPPAYQFSFFSIFKSKIKNKSPPCLATNNYFLIFKST